jgi:RNA polymerase sigma-70 factor (ECF subfamily)
MRSIDGDSHAPLPEPGGGLELATSAEEMAALRGYLKRRMRDGQDLDDMVQDVYLRVLSTPETGPVANVRGFLRRVASNLLIDRYRRKAARLSDNHTTLDEQIVDDGALAPERIASGRQELALLGDALEAIGPVARDAFLLVRVEGFSHKEAAQRLGITPKAVSHHVERTLARMAERLAMPQGAVPDEHAEPAGKRPSGAGRAVAGACAPWQRGRSRRLSRLVAGAARACRGDGPGRAGLARRAPCGAGTGPEGARAGRRGAGPCP